MGLGVIVYSSFPLLLQDGVIVYDWELLYEVWEIKVTQQPQPTFTVTLLIWCNVDNRNTHTPTMLSNDMRRNAGHNE